MSQAQIPSTTKVCATCSMWLGPRTPHYQSHYVILEDSAQSTYGKCGHQMNSDTKKQGCANCSKYEKWSVLK